MAAAVDSVVAVAPAESAIAGKRFLLIEQAKGCHEIMAPFFYAQGLSTMCHAVGGARSIAGELFTLPLLVQPPPSTD